MLDGRVAREDTEEEHVSTTGHDVITSAPVLVSVREVLLPLDLLLDWP